MKGLQSDQSDLETLKHRVILCHLQKAHETKRRGSRSGILWHQATRRLETADVPSRMYMCMYVSIYIHNKVENIYNSYTEYAYIYIYMHVCIYIYMYIYIYVSIHICTHTPSIHDYN